MVTTINRDELKAKIDRGERFQFVETLPEPAFQKAHLPGGGQPAAGPAARVGAPSPAPQGRGDRRLLF